MDKKPVKTNIILLVLIVAAAITGYIAFDKGNLKKNTSLQAKAYVISDKAAASVDTNVVVSSNKFAFKIFRKLYEENSKENIFISPLSISTALAMTYIGAEGSTKEAMAKVLEIGITHKEIEREYSNLLVSLNNVDEQAQLDIANSLWLRKSFELAIKDDFVSRSKAFFNSEVFTRDFSEQNVILEINNWIMKETNGKIERVIDHIGEDVMMFLINSIYFNGEWTEKFDENATKVDDFFLADGQSIKVNMMYNTTNAKFSYYEGENFSASRFPYGREKIAMYVFLPDEGVPVDLFLQGLNQESFDDYIAGFKNVTNLTLAFPKFKLEYGVKRLNDALEMLGMGIAFSDQADFTGITDAGLSISFIDHKAGIEVNEKGTKAAAATVVGLGRETAPILKKFVVNRPFFFVIRDDRSGVVLFLGKVLEPTSV